MPKDVRKRGKKNKKHKEAQQDLIGKVPLTVEVTNVEEDSQQQVNISGSPFGDLNPEVKEYFKTVGQKLQEWSLQPVPINDLEEEGHFFQRSLDGEVAHTYLRSFVIIKCRIT